MRRSFGLVALTAVTAAVAPVAAVACSICTPDIQRRQSLRQEAGLARLVVYGKLTESRIGADGNGQTDVTIEQVVKDDPFLAGKRTITVPRFIPVDPKQPPHYLIFCDVFQNKLDPYRGSPVQSAAVVDYLKGAMALDEKDRTKALQYYFKHLDSADPDVAADAFLEFAKAA